MWAKRNISPAVLADCLQPLWSRWSEGWVGRGLILGSTEQGPSNLPAPENLALLGQHTSQSLVWMVIKDIPHLLQPLTCYVSETCSFGGHSMGGGPWEDLPCGQHNPFPSARTTFDLSVPCFVHNEYKFCSNNWSSGLWADAGKAEAIMERDSGSQQSPALSYGLSAWL